MGLPRDVTIIKSLIITCTHRTRCHAKLSTHRNDVALLASIILVDKAMQHAYVPGFFF